jgi:hypothetical protein
MRSAIRPYNRGPVGGFVEMFRLDPGGERPKDGQEEVVRPAWFAPPEDELGVSVPLAVVVSRSDKAVVALRHVTAYSTGVTLELVAAGRNLREVEAQRLFHEQHIADPDEGLPEGSLRVGIEFADGRRVSNLSDRRHLWGQPDQEPEGPLLMQSGGGGGSAGSGRVTMNPAYWLWPLPPSGTLHLFVEWPSLGIALSSADLDGSAIVAAASKSQPLWNDGGKKTEAR